MPRAAGRRQAAGGQYLHRCRADAQAQARRQGLVQLAGTRHARPDQALLANHQPAQRVFQPGLPDARRLYRRGGVLGRVQHRAGADQHRTVLHRLPRDARQRLPGAAGHHPFHQPQRRARQVFGLPCAAQLDHQDGAQDAGLQGGLGQDLRHRRHPREIPGAPAYAGPARMGPLQGQRFAGMPQLSRLPVNGLHPAEPRAQAMHSTYLANKEKTCIDCHKGIAHHLPDMSKAEVK
ncbi:protein of unknown function (plasmid) [Cupriavidus taiwanensis]|nr:protein of unknown function [Cupriavidus taiwanensis]